ncbi:lipoic acid synthetase [Isosphaera pallida ATCC 43644]|uniref:Lipoyl synthase n=1 Tax=Isosphaera pallida (strain ATCC 43644 / DSM 9630 / IS1B) TaxID=575540 RepID=E8QX99_ISOPI|nr:lipoyl synthase [Isosphaera pallida]ADV61940.1 lipoic acid synthetase [Isosphaera pallida ATCC 43644]
MNRGASLSQSKDAARLLPALPILSTVDSTPLPSASAATVSFSAPTVGLIEAVPEPIAVRSRRLPPWLKRPIPRSGGMGFTNELIKELGLETICASGKCPNRSECWTRRTASFMILGDTCTRPCGFCAVKRGRPDAVAQDEPQRLAEACARLGLQYVVITSVTRDDLPDGGASHFKRCVEAVRERTGATVEVLTPDFNGDLTAVDVVLEASPEVFNHNLETVARLQRWVRRKSQYTISLKVLAHAKRARPDLLTKSGLMLGLGETTEEILETLADLRSIGCDLLTLGQYLQPSPKHLPVQRYLPPEEFDELGELARQLGFRDVASGPFVRSSYHADEMAKHAAHAQQQGEATEVVLPSTGGRKSG